MWIIVTALVVCAEAAQLVVMSAWGVFGAPDSSDTVLIVDDTHVAFQANVPAGTAISTIDAADVDGCGHVSYDLTRYGLMVEVPRADCAPDDDNHKTMNGRHGDYRTFGDVPDPKNVAKVHTWLGPATVFEQTYDEFTNEHNRYQEPVAIIAVDDPVDARYPTIVVRSDRGELDRDAFTKLVESFEEPSETKQRGSSSPVGGSTHS
ncbi:MAG TPA: hypothetical protein VE172_18940 [Stackebrandtia sp.]|jgi:hypothetical protein|uniref:hypothetical protein n=1 Tax=Stackebrandtia sp. TaxID=2023065 RepID=UPI002D54A62A|nr:hypothetical protein [Stackebrandtia sp.]HZE40880.1 hypothetical protein [Stackebrandtia sp.]